MAISVSHDHELGPRLVDAILHAVQLHRLLAAEESTKVAYEGEHDGFLRPQLREGQLAPVQIANDRLCRFRLEDRHCADRTVGSPRDASARTISDPLDDGILIALNSHSWHISAMRFDSLLAAVGDQPVFETGFLLAGDVDAKDVRRQLSRWVAGGQLVQLRRGLYALAPPYRKTEPHPFLVANCLVRGSYVSLQSALAYHGLIPEHVPVVTSITTGRPQQRDVPFGSFEYHHCPPGRLTGYRAEDLGGGQEALVATPARALADLIHLVPGADSTAYLSELRLTNLEKLGPAELREPTVSDRPKIRRAFRRLAALGEERP